MTMKKFKIAIVLIAFVFAFVLLFVCYDCVAKGVTSGLYLCSNVIIPTLFPLLCLNSFFINTGVVEFFQKHFNKFCKRFFNLSGYFLPIFLISLISSYPVGAFLSNTLYENKKISLLERNNIALISCSAGPSFVVLAVGVNILKSFECGVLLLVCHILSSLTVAVLISRRFEFSGSFCASQQKISVSDALVKGVAAGSNSIISICAYTILFSAIINILSTFLRFTPMFLPLVCTLEVTNACVVLGFEKASLSVICAVLGFGGFSIIFQVSSMLKNNRPPLLRLILVRIFHAAVSFLYCEIGLKFFKITIPVLKSTTPIAGVSNNNILFPLSLILLAIVFLNFLNNSIKQEI